MLLIEFIELNPSTYGRVSTPFLIVGGNGQNEALLCQEKTVTELFPKMGRRVGF